MKILSGQPDGYLASQLATALSVPLIPLTLKRCNNGELLVCVDKNLVYGQKVAIVHVLDTPVNSSLMDLLLMIDAVKSAQPQFLTLVLPYYAYGRQDRPTHDSTGYAARLVAHLLAIAGIDQLITIDAHQPNILKEAPFEVSTLSAVSLFADLIQQRNPLPLIIAPDQGAADRAEALAARLGTDWTVLTKQRFINGDIVMSSLMTTVEKRDCIIIDDIIDSGKTLCLVVDYLLKKGAKRVDAFITHGILGSGCLDRLKQSSLESLTITNTVPINTPALDPKMNCIDITPVLVPWLV